MRKDMMRDMVVAATVGAAKARRSKTPPKPAKLAVRDDGTIQFGDPRRKPTVKLEPASRPEQLVPPGEPLTKQALAVARKQFDAERKQSAMSKKGK